MRRPEVGHLGFEGAGLSFGDIDGGGYKHGRDVHNLRDIHVGFIHAKAFARSWALGDGRFGWWRINVINTSVLVVAEGRRSVVSFS